MIIFEHVDKIYPKQVTTGHSFKELLSFRRQKKSISEPEFTALHDINFTIEQGESVGIVGANGAGKSTLLKLLTRVARPSRGTVRVHGRISSLLEVGAGFHHELSGRENIFLSGAILGMPQHVIRKKFDAIVDFAGLNDVIDVSVKKYSTGMFLRLAFSVGIHLDSDILVIDEALAVGDREFQIRCYEKIRDFNACGGTLILVSHDESQLKAVCQRGLLMAHGKLIMDASLTRALHQYSLSI